MLWSRCTLLPHLSTFLMDTARSLVVWVGSQVNRSIEISALTLSVPTSFLFFSRILRSLSQVEESDPTSFLRPREPLPPSSWSSPSSRVVSLVRPPFFSSPPPFPDLFVAE